MRRSQGPKASTPRLACVRPAASVHPEPGSNSSSYIFNIFTIFIARSVFFDKSSSYSLFMLSIQYVYERVILFLSASPSPAVALSVEAGAEVQLLFIPASFFKNNFLFFFEAHFKGKSS